MVKQTKCPKCESTSFELNSGTKVDGCRHNIHFIQCASCGAAISVVSDRHNFLFEEIAKKLGIS